LAVIFDKAQIFKMQNIQKLISLLSICLLCLVESEAQKIKHTDSLTNIKSKEQNITDSIPITDPSDLVEKRKNLLLQWEKIKTRLQRVEKLDDQIKILDGPFKVFEKMQKEKTIITKKHITWATNVLKIIKEEQWLKELKTLVEQTSQLLTYISSLTEGAIINF
jgi:hypothetical protein